MKTLLVAAFAVVLLCHAPHALARLDETAEQCAARYGTPVRGVDNETLPGTTDNHYAKNGVEIVATFLHGRAVCIIFAKENNAEFTSLEIQTLLTANQGTSSWGAAGHLNHSVVDSKSPTFWERADGASAVMLPSHTLVLTTKSYKDERNRIASGQLDAAKKAKAGETSLNGF